jgi:hypothetical protein
MKVTSAITGTSSMSKEEVDTFLENKLICNSVLLMTMGILIFNQYGSITIMIEKVFDNYTQNN